MPIELERKFLLSQPPEAWDGVDLLAVSAGEINQGYLTPLGARVEVRLRKMREVAIESADRDAPGSRTGPGGVHVLYKLSIKGDRDDPEVVGLSRNEIEVNLAEADFADAWPLTDGRRLTKVRKSYTYRTAEDDKPMGVSVDRFRGPLEGVLLAEIEFEDPGDAAAFVPPPFLGIEVSSDPRYRNSELASASKPPERPGAK